MPSINFYQLPSIVLISILIFSPGFRNRWEQTPQQTIVILPVDTTADYNDAAHQVCDPAIVNDCSLRGAITRANHDPANEYLIWLSATTYNLSLVGMDDTNEAGDLDFFTNVEIIGHARSDTFINANQIDRVAHIHSGAQVKFSKLDLTNGLAYQSQNGGGIYNAGTLDLENAYVSNSRAGDGLPSVPTSTDSEGGKGGGIYNIGILHIQEAYIHGNYAGDGGAAGEIAGKGGHGGDGGGIYNLGTLEIIRGWVYSNHAGLGGDGTGGDSVGVGGDGGDGGDIANYGWASLYSSRLGSSVAGAGGKGGDSLWQGGFGGKGGDGGGIYNQGYLVVQGGHVQGSITGAGGAGGEGPIKLDPIGGAPGQGGGLYNTGFSRLTDLRISGNQTAAPSYN